MKNFFKNKKFLITGGTGSFGNQMVKFLIKTNIKKIIIFSRDEKKQEELRNFYNSKKLQFFIGDVRDYHSIYNSTKNVDYIFHAAALKQVPSCEFYPLEAINTNTLGANNVMRAAYENKVKKCVLLSTDKAVYPINAMGMTKALTEKLMRSNSRIYDSGSTTFCATRYGNVAASRGSVIPLFIEQIKKKKPITITDTEMTRFLMSLDDSVSLVLSALKYAKSGDIFVQKANACKIIDLAEAIKEMYSNKKIKNKIIGIRHGEKKHETLVSKEELLVAKEFSKYFRIPNDDRDLNYNNYFIKGNTNVSSKIDYSSNSTKILTKHEIKKFIKKLKIND
ncbi:polysaccharide biosynthesis protein [Pelagibacterales bacterium SAG-MED35]|nr:polysaccharide biosynthesis protein [Pelagibacterales bacterium SAG-MED35]